MEIGMCCTHACSRSMIVACLPAHVIVMYAGMIMWPKSKRGVSDETARSIADAAKAHRATPVGVFVDETAAVIAQR